MVLLAFLLFLWLGDWWLKWHIPVHFGSPPVRRASANVVSIIAKYAVPSGEWPDLLPFLFQCSQSAQEEHREVCYHPVVIMQYSFKILCLYFILCGNLVQIVVFWLSYSIIQLISSYSVFWVVPCCLQRNPQNGNSLVVNLARNILSFSLYLHVKEGKL